eukprot:202891_1
MLRSTRIMAYSQPHYIHVKFIILLVHIALLVSFISAAVDHQSITSLIPNTQTIHQCQSITQFSKDILLKTPDPTQSPINHPITFHLSNQPTPSPNTAPTNNPSWHPFIRWS